MISWAFNATDKIFSMRLSAPTGRLLQGMWWTLWTSGGSCAFWIFLLKTLRMSAFLETWWQDYCWLELLVSWSNLQFRKESVVTGPQRMPIMIFELDKAVSTLQVASRNETWNCCFPRWNAAPFFRDSKVDRFNQQNQHLHVCDNMFVVTHTFRERLCHAVYSTGRTSMKKESAWYSHLNSVTA